MMRNSLDLGLVSHPHAVPSSVPPSSLYSSHVGSGDPVPTNGSWAQYGGLVNMPKYAFNGKPPQGKNEVQYDHCILR